MKMLVLPLVMLLAGLGCTAVPASVRAQEPLEPPAAMYAALIFSKGYVVGSTLTASGLTRADVDAAGDTTWVHLGHNNPRVNAIDHRPDDPRTFYTAAGNGVHRTTDGGASWRIVTDWRVTEVQDVAVDPNAPANVYLGSAYGVWRSADGGDTWTESNDGIPVGETYIEALDVDRTQAHRVVAGTDDGVYVSEDGARTWRQAGGDGLAILDLRQSATAPDVWLAATFRNGLLRSTDNARTWERVGPQDIRDKSIHGAGIDPFDEQRMAVAGWDTGVWVSDDGGRSWRQRGRGLPIDDFYELTFDANVPGRIWAATVEEGLYYSDDMGRTWTDAGLTGTLIFDLGFVPAGRTEQ